MQDRFKFRIFNKEYNKIYTWEDIIDKKGGCSLYWCMLQAQNNEANNVLMQCTGLKDENCKLIYEGDIVKTLYTRPDGVVINRNCVVEFNRCAFWINYGIGASYLDNDDCIYEVIGNIYENKELLND